MAGLGFRTFVSGEVLTAANVNGYLMEQAVMVFASASARSTAIAAPSEGMVSYLTDTNVIQYYDGAAWVGVVQNALVDAKGDLVAATADNTPARLAVGSNGQMLMADSAATTGLRYVDPPTNRNLVINSAMQVAQRSTSVTGITSGQTYHTADRWQTEVSSAGTWTQTVENDGPTGSGLRKSLKMLCTTADNSLASTDFARVFQKLEGQDLQRVKKGTSSAEQLTLSFWVKANVTGTYVCVLEDTDNSRSIGASYTISASATWERKTITFAADTTGAFDNDNAASMWVQFWLAAGSNFGGGSLNTSWAGSNFSNGTFAGGQTNLAAATNNYWQVTGVQLETGPVATPFEFEPYEATLRKCQRYYYRDTPGATQGAFGGGFNTLTTQSIFSIPFPVPMRVTPTALDQTGTATDYRVAHGNTETNCSSVPTISSVTTSNVGCALFTVASGLTAGQGSQARAGSATSYLGWSAEL